MPGVSGGPGGSVGEQMLMGIDGERPERRGDD